MEKMLDDEKKWIGKESSFNGLALSGGGIRAATFGLGILQAMERHGILLKIHYLSTVSGGGYIGTLYTYFKNYFGTDNPDCIVSSPKKRVAPQTPEPEEWLRCHGEYLKCKEGGTWWALLIPILSGSLLNWLCIFSALLIPITLIECCNEVEVVFHYLGFGFLLIYAGMTLISMALSKLKELHRIENFLEICSVRFLKCGLLLMAIAYLPKIAAYATTALLPAIGDNPWVTLAIIALPLMTISAYLVSTKPKTGGNIAITKEQIENLLGVVLTIVLVALAAGSVHLIHHLVAYLREIGMTSISLIVAASILLLIAFLVDVNHISLHTMYRRSLRKAYMPVLKYPDPKKKGEQIKSKPNDFLLREIQENTLPYHIINTNMVTINSKNLVLNNRCGENFIFSPLYCGSASTRYLPNDGPTEKFIGGKMRLSTAAAISGAAVNANNAATKSRPLTMIMSLFNIRTGYWIENPNSKFRSERFPFMNSFIHRNYLYCLFREFFQCRLSEDRNKGSVLLSDGGHFENLGLYELIRRKCKKIIIIDSGRDVHYEADDLYKAIRLARTDFKTTLRIKENYLDIRDPETGMPEFPVIWGEINYNTNNKDAENGTFLYIKPALVPKLPGDVMLYQKQHNDFPQESTADQIFDEKQFEAYRLLGFYLGEQIFNPKNPGYKKFKKYLP